MKEVMQQALEALKEADQLISLDSVAAAIVALESALAAPDSYCEATTEGIRLTAPAYPLDVQPVSAWGGVVAPAQDPLPTMRAAFRTEVTCPIEKLYEMRFKFQSLHELELASKEWRDTVYSAAPAQEPVSKTEREELIAALRDNASLAQAEQQRQQAADMLEADARQEQEPRAWLREWAFQGVTPAKEKNANGRMVWPKKLLFLPVTQHRCLPDDKPLYTQPAPIPQGMQLVRTSSLNAMAVIYGISAESLAHYLAKEQS